MMTDFVDFEDDKKPRYQFNFLPVYVRLRGGLITKDIDMTCICHVRASGEYDYVCDVRVPDPVSTCDSREHVRDIRIRDLEYESVSHGELACNVCDPDHVSGCALTEFTCDVRVPDLVSRCVSKQPVCDVRDPDHGHMSGGFSDKNVCEEFVCNVCNPDLVSGCAPIEFMCDVRVPDLVSRCVSKEPVCDVRDPDHDHMSGGFPDENVCEERDPPLPPRYVADECDVRVPDLVSGCVFKEFDFVCDVRAPDGYVCEVRVPNLPLRHDAVQFYEYDHRTREHNDIVGRCPVRDPPLNADANFLDLPRPVWSGNAVLHALPDSDSFLFDLTNKDARFNLTRLRISAHNLEIERGRYSNTARDERLCKGCLIIGISSVDDEGHLLYDCTPLGGLRANLPTAMRKALSMSPGTPDDRRACLRSLFDDANENHVNHTILKQLGLFIRDCFKQREPA